MESSEVSLVDNDNIDQVPLFVPLVNASLQNSTSVVLFAQFPAKTEIASSFNIGMNALEVVSERKGKVSNS